MVTYGTGRGRNRRRLVRLLGSGHRSPGFLEGCGVSRLAVLSAVAILGALVLTAATLDTGSQTGAATGVIAAIPQIMAAIFILVGGAGAALAVAVGTGAFEHSDT